MAPANWMLNNKLYMITSDSENLDYICAFLNSKIFSKIIMSSVNFGGGKGVDFMGEIYLPFLNSPFTFSNKQSHEMDAYFYSLFDLDDSEISFIESL